MPAANVVLTRFCQVPVTPNSFRGPIIEGMPKQVRHDTVSKKIITTLAASRWQKNI